MKSNRPAINFHLKAQITYICHIDSQTIPLVDGKIYDTDEKNKC